MGAGASSCPSPGLSVLKSEDESVLRQIEVDDLSSPPETLLTPPPLPLKLGLEGLDLSSLATQAPFLETLLPPVFQHLVFLNVSSNDLTLTELLPLLQPASPLAALNLSSNPRLFETDAPPLPPLGCADLLLLDVSFCPAPEADEDYLSLRLFLKNFPKLLSFSAESAGLSRALEGVLLDSLPECEELVLADNEIEELGGTLSKMMKLKDLDLRENEATNTGHYRARVQEMLPRLSRLDNQFCTVVAAASEDSAATTASIKKGVEAADQLADETSAAVNETEFNAAMTGKVDNTVVA